MEIINGTELSAKIRQTIKQEVEEIKAQGKRPPLLSVILVGDNPASQSYVRGKEKACLSVGMENRTIRLDAGISKWSAKAESLSSVVGCSEISGSGLLVGVIPVRMPS